MASTSDSLDMSSTMAAYRRAMVAASSGLTLSTFPRIRGESGSPPSFVKKGTIIRTNGGVSSSGIKSVVGRVDYVDPDQIILLSVTVLYSDGRENILAPSSAWQISIPVPSGTRKVWFEEDKLKETKLPKVKEIMQDLGL